MADIPKEDLECIIAVWLQSVTSLQNFKLPVAIGQSLDNLNVMMFHTLEKTKHQNSGPNR